MNGETYIKAQLAEWAILEGARHGGVNNMVAVAFVMVNRVNAGWYGGDWEQVIHHAWERGGTMYEPTRVNLRDGDVKLFLQRIDDIFDGSEDDTLTNGALFYCELHRVDRGWFKTHVLHDRTEHPLVATVGQVTFFK